MTYLWWVRFGMNGVPVVAEGGMNGVPVVGESWV